VADRNGGALTAKQLFLIYETPCSDGMAKNFRSF
jgi:hypothetical protein